MDILEAATEVHIDQVRARRRGFVGWHRQRHATDLRLIDAYFDEKAFDAELASLPGKYAPPKARLLLAFQHGQPAGRAALREIEAANCERKRMFVCSQFHGQGTGRALAETLISEARAIGYRGMRRDTGPRQVEMQDLCHRLGFKDIPPYYDLPEELRIWLLFRELDLENVTHGLQFWPGGTQ
jgi:putative acetyltransferase